VNSSLTSETESFQLVEQLKRGAWQTQGHSCTFIKEQTAKLLWQWEPIPPKAPLTRPSTTKNYPESVNVGSD